LNYLYRIIYVIDVIYIFVYLIDVIFFYIKFSLSNQLIELIE